MANVFVWLKKKYFENFGLLKVFRKRAESWNMEAKKSNVKLNALLDIEKIVQTKWESDKVFEENAPDAKS